MSITEKRSFSFHVMAAALVTGLLTAGISVSAEAAEMKDVPMVRDGSAAPTPWKRDGNWPKTTWDAYNTLADPNRSPPPPKKGVLRPVTVPIEDDPV